MNKETVPKGKPINFEKAKNTLSRFEHISINGLVSVLGVNSVGIINYYDNNTISEEAAQEIQSKIYTNDRIGPKIINILSFIHDEWVRGNPNIFLRVDKDENGNDIPRNKEYKFVPLQMLNWKEAKKYLQFLEPILEAAGIKIDEDEIEEQFEISQIEFLLDNDIDSPDKLRNKLKEGSKFYAALKGLETKDGESINKLLKNVEVLEKIAGQVEGQIAIRSRKEIALDLIQSDNELLNDLFWVQTVKRNNKNDVKSPYISEPASKREILLSKAIGKPYPTYFGEGDEIQIEDSYGHEYAIDAVSNRRNFLAFHAIEPSDSKLYKKGVISFVYGFNREIKQEYIEVSKRDLILHQLDPDKLGWKERTINNKRGKVSPKDIVKAAIHRELNREEVGNKEGYMRRFFDYLFRGKV